MATLDEILQKGRPVASNAPQVNPQDAIQGILAKGQPVRTPEALDRKSAIETKALFPSETGEGVVAAGLKSTGNVPGSFFQLVKGLGEAAIHPIVTGKSIFKTVRGAGELLGGKILSLAGVEQKKIDRAFSEEADMARAVGSFFKERYGSLEAAQRTATNDPFGVGADIMALLAGGSSTAIRLSKAKNIARLEKLVGLEAGTVERGALATQRGLVKTGEVAARTALAPPRAAGKLVKGVATGGTGATTGKGGFVTERALTKPTPAFTRGLRTGEGEGVVVKVRDGLQTLRRERGATYVKRLNAIEKANPKSLNIQPIRSKFNSLLKNFGVEVTADGALDFSRAAITKPGSESNILNIMEDLKSWGTKPGDRTAVGLDTLKRRLDSFFSPNGQERAFVTAMQKEVSKILKDNVSGYTEMTADYERMSKLITEIEKSLGANPKAAVDTTIRKLTIAAKEDSGFRRKLLEELERATGEDLIGELAGVALSPAAPSGFSVLALSGGGLGIVGGLLSPQFMFALALTSPRLVGELLRAIGLTSQGIQKVNNFLKTLKARVGARPSSIVKPATETVQTTPSVISKKVGSIVGKAKPKGKKLTEFDTPEIIAAREAQAQVKPTSLLSNSKRVQLRIDTANKLYGSGAKNKDKVLDIVLGNPGSGKSTVLAEPLAKKRGSLIVDADEAKKLLPEFKGGSQSGALHQESSDIIDTFLLNKALNAGDNVVLPIVGKTYEGLVARIDDAIAKGYKVNVNLVSIPAKESGKRVATRFTKTGKFVDPDYAINVVGDRPVDNFYRLIAERGEDINQYAHFDNLVPQGNRPKIVTLSSNNEILTDIAERALELTKTQGGATITLSGEVPKSGFVTAVSKTTEKVIPEAQLTVTQLKDYMKANLKDLTKENRHIGIWVDEGNAFLDTPMVLKDKGKAIEVGKKADQIAIFDISMGETINLK